MALAAALAVGALSASCSKSAPAVVQPIECPDPCCGGNGGTDCGEYPNITCMQDADVCVAMEYGCSNGLFFTTVPPTRPLSCIASEGGTLTLGDAQSSSAIDAGDTLSAVDAQGPSADGGADALEIDAQSADGT